MHLDYYSLFLYRTRIRVRVCTVVHLQQCKLCFSAIWVSYNYSVFSPRLLQAEESGGIIMITTAVLTTLSVSLVPEFFISSSILSQIIFCEWTNLDGFHMPYTLLARPESAYWLDEEQWRIQNFPTRDANLWRQPIIWQDFPRKLHENMKMKEVGPRGGAPIHSAPLDPLMKSHRIFGETFWQFYDK